MQYNEGLKKICVYIFKNKSTLSRKRLLSTEDVVSAISELGRLWQRRDLKVNVVKLQHIK